MHYLTVDDILSGTGIRDSVSGGFINAEELGLSVELASEISTWLKRYAEAHYNQFKELEANAVLDREGIAICERMRVQLPQSKIDYFSSAEMRKIAI